MKRLLLSLSLLAFGLSAQAADYKQPNRYIQTQTWNWTGPYAGIQGSYILNSEVNHFVGTIQADGYSGGVFAGFNKQYGNFVIGAEAEWNWASMTGNQNIGPVNISHSLEAYGAIKGRLGLAYGPYMIYGHGGLAFAETNATISVGGFSTTANTNHQGFTYGAGLEAMFATNWTARVEYSLWDFDSASYGFPIVGPIGFATPADLKFQTIKAGVAYRF